MSTADAFALRGAKIVFVDIRPDTMNIDERLIESAITPKTRAIVPVHYAGVACEMDTIMDIASLQSFLWSKMQHKALKVHTKARLLVR